jgi:hypothetical protein
VDKTYYKDKLRFGYKGMIEFENKYKPMIENNEISKNVETIYLSFDHGS